MEAIFYLVGIVSLMCGLFLCGLATHRSYKWLIEKRDAKRYQEWLEGVINDSHKR